MAYQHPTTSLYIGTLSANIKRALPDQSTLQQEVLCCIQEALYEAARIKREGQRLIGSFIDCLSRMGLEHLSDSDREILNCFCPGLSKKDAEDVNAAEEEGAEEEEGAAEEDDTDLEGSGKKGKGTGQLQFFMSFLVCLYSGNNPRNTGMAQKVRAFISRLQDLGLYVPPPPRLEQMPFTPTDLVRSVAGQLTVELKNMYKKGSYGLYKKV